MKIRFFVGGFALFLATQSLCFAKPGEIYIEDQYDGVEYHFAEKFAKALKTNKKANVFHIFIGQGGGSIWSGGTVLYNRKKKTLKTYTWSDSLMNDNEDGVGKYPDLAKREHSKEA